MKLLPTFSSIVRSDISETKKSLLTLAKKGQKLMTVTSQVFMQPANTIYGIIASVLSVLLAFWFANIGIIQAVFASSALTSWSKLEFLFTMVGTLVRNLSWLHVWLIIIHAVVWCLVSAFWLEAIKIQHERVRLRPRFAPTILATLCVGAIAIIAISLVTPAITREGISVFVSGHYSGTLLLLFVIVAETVLLKKSARLIQKSP